MSTVNHEEFNYVKDLLIETIYRAQFMMPTNDRDLQRFDEGASVHESDYIERLCAFVLKYQPEAIHDDQNAKPDVDE